MSAPNKSYDPKQVAILSAEALEAARAAGLEAFASATDLEVLGQARSAHLVGNDAPIRLAQREIGALPPAAKGEAGQRLNDVRSTLQQAYDVRLGELEADRDARVLLEEAVDVTLPTGDLRPPGARHPLTTIQEQVSDVFIAMGWEVAEGPEVEAQWFNFDALAIGPDHPSRSDHDTLYIAPEGSGVCLRTQTSPVQIRTMLQRELPIAIVCPGRVYRADTMDATHLPVFSQVEGLLVDEGITMAHLKGTLDHLAAAMFGPGTVTRLRPSYFPFVEPGAEVDYQCHTCHGETEIMTAEGAVRCPTCRGEGWIEWGGCGMVAPAVLRACGVVPTEDGGPWSGFAFGMGLERTVMARHDVRDIRDLIEGDVRVTMAIGSD